eukprot:gene16358-19416_t
MGILPMKGTVTATVSCLLAVCSLSGGVARECSKPAYPVKLQHPQQSLNCDYLESLRADLEHSGAYQSHHEVDTVRLFQVDERRESDPVPGDPWDSALIKGTNYVPSYAKNAISAWIDFDARIFETELGYAEEAKINTIRIFLHWLPWQHDKQQFLLNISKVVEIASSKSLRTVFVLFDSYGRYIGGTDTEYINTSPV